MTIENRQNIEKEKGMKLHVEFEIFDLSGKALAERANRYIAEMLLDHKSNPLKAYELAININKNESIDIDTTDLKLIEDAVISNQRFNNLVKGAILKEIECQKIIESKK